MTYPPESAASDSIPPGPNAQERDPRVRATLVEGPIARTLLFFSLPTLASSVLQSLNASINAAWIGQLLGERALSASANANSLIFFLLGAVFGLGLAATVLVGQSMGANDPVLAKRTIGTSVCFFGGLSVLLATLGIVFAPYVLRLMRTPPDALPFASAYLRVIFIALPGMYLFTFTMMALRGAGDAKTPFKFALLSALLDVTLNPLLIRGVGPIPALGIAGSAAATLIAQWTSLIALIVSLYRRKHFLRITRHELRFLHFDPEILRALLFKGVPMGLQIVVVSSSMIAMISLVNQFGSRTTAAYGACFQLWNYIQMPAFAVGSAVSSMAAQNVGAGRWDRVARVTQVGVLYNVLLTGVLVLAVTAASHYAFKLFLGDSLEAIRIAQHIHSVVSWSFVLFGVSFVLSSVMRATGAVVPPLVILFVALWLVRIPFAYLLSPSWHAEAIWWSFGVGSITSVLLCTLYYRSGRWRKSHMLEAPT
ncbi:MAG TPA: MATE family efflux transporter [Polyangiales bacterium]|nr:MATE family efflux transporter [Polyangiales bacterium]